MTDIKEIRQHLIDIQTQLAYQEDTVRELNNALALQQQEILVMRRQLQLLKQRQEESASGLSAADAGQETPPHY